MLTLNFTKFDKEDEINMQEIMPMYATEIRFALIEEVIYALENDLDEAIFLCLQPGDYDVGCPKNSFLQVLERNLDNLAKDEEYELCSESLKWITKLTPLPNA